MPTALIGLAGGALGGLFGKSGNQGGVNQTGTSTDVFNRTGTSQQQGTTKQQQTLDPTAMGYLQKLFPQIQQAIGQAQQPVFGEAQKAGYLGDLDRLTKGSIQALQQNLARSGASNSGRMSQGLTDIGLNRDTQASQFFSQIPFLNRQATMSQLPGLFGAMGGAISQAPKGMTGSFDTTGRTTEQGTDVKTSMEQQRKQGMPWWKAMLGGALGGLSGMGRGGTDPESMPVMPGTGPFPWINRND